MFGSRKVKIAAISDTHGNNKQILKAIEDGREGDIFIHAGDFTHYNNREHVDEFIEIVKKLKFKHKIVIPGNHELLLDPHLTEEDLKSLLGRYYKYDKNEGKRIREKFHDAGIILLSHEKRTIEGIKIFASEYSVIPKMYVTTAFQLEEEKLEKIWEGVPNDIDLLITHCPAYGILDQYAVGKYAGSKTIRNYLEKSQVTAHICGHIHEAKGQTTFQQTKCFNVAEKLKIFEICK